MVNLRAACLLAVSLAPLLACNAEYDVIADDDVRGVVYAEERAFVTEERAANGLPRWIGPTIGEPSDKACYRKTIRTKQCPPGYDFDKVATCWVQCPLEYPVECGMECLPQNSDCTEAILSKVTSVATAALNAASSGVFGQLAKASKGVQQGFKCGQQLLSAVQKVQGYIDELKSSGKVGSSTDEILFALSKSTFVTSDLTNAVATCLGKPVPTSAEKADDIAKMVSNIAAKALDAKSQGKNLLEPKNFIEFVSDVGLGTAMPEVKAEDVSKIKDTVTAGMGCGDAVNSVVNRVVAMVKEAKTKDASATVEALRLAVMSSDLVLKELPDAVTGCFDAKMPDAFKKRDEVLKAVHVVLDGAIEASSKEDKPLSTSEYALRIVDLGLDAIAMFDPTGIANMAKEFVQPICGPSSFIGEIDDGSADKALGLRSMEKAFMSSSGDWKKQGDGKLSITFKSVDDKDVEVILHSGGDEKAKVKVAKGQTVEWSAPLAEYGGKTLYLDRWRSGFLGIPGTGGGSLLLWVPGSSTGGLKLDVTLNPTSFKDKSLRG
ncbi:hypothetical protein Poli38472_011642 [Pythium oligandrum]|uniref:Uncharacterized protein n=1 Tax=Pythium oligandrum TaxID=41045 RepID=A0A8K1CJS8_PYTOL|nr:hypothetical protein Poli38472_011640 [Pythium oligandrum]TMW64762.1 hypothetical protein Poli38472_011642 [Pythium oligandrum]|eukprot:TMW64760.1 hypothetical protein Poli38472_011640 [Pythium oligandrum]